MGTRFKLLGGPITMKPKKGDKVDCQDTTGRWAKGVIIDVTKQAVTLHYEGFKKIYDEVISKDAWSQRLAPRGQFTGATKKPKPKVLGKNAPDTRVNVHA